MPLRCVDCLSRAERNPDRAEPSGDDRRLKLCFQQSTGNSPLPEADVPFCFSPDALRDKDVPDLKPAGRLEHPRHFLESCKFVGKEIQHPIRNDDVGPTIGYRE